MDKKTTISNAGESTEAVLNYLRKHPRLLVEHPEVLSEIIIPHTSGAATSLVERQVSVLREQIRQLKNKLRELVEIARDNGVLSERLHLLAEKMLQAESLEALLLTIRKTLMSDFRADRAILRLFAQQPQSNGAQLDEFVGDDWPEKSFFEETLNNRQPVCGRLRQQQHVTLFGDELPEYGSSVLLPLSGKGWTGLLAIGSQNPQRFDANMGTEILSQMADIVTLAINPYVRPFDTVSE